MSDKLGPAMGPWTYVIATANAYGARTMSTSTPPRSRAERLLSRPAAGAGSLEYVAALAIAAIIIGGVVLGVSGARVDVFAARAVCLIQSVVGAGQCAEAIGDGPDGGGGPGGVNEPWYCQVFGIGCSDQPGTDPADVDIPEGLDPESAIVQTMLSTERGRQTLQWLADHGIPIVIDPGETGAYWNGSEIVLGSGFDNAAVLVHEANHARYAEEGRHADVDALDRQEYITAAIDEEVAGTVLQILSAKEFRDAGATLGQQPAEAAYDQAYQQTIRNGGTQAQAQQAGYQAVNDEFYNGGIVASTNGNSYSENYGDYWDSEH